MPLALTRRRYCCHISSFKVEHTVSHPKNLFTYQIIRNKGIKYLEIGIGDPFTPKMNAFSSPRFPCAKKEGVKIAKSASRTLS